jgi:hypothetical protein
LKKLQGFQASKDPDLRKKRKLLLKGLNYVFKNLMINMKSVHIRIEVTNSKESVPPVIKSSGIISAIGITIPLCKLTPNSAVGIWMLIPLLMPLAGLHFCVPSRCNF